MKKQKNQADKPGFVLIVLREERFVLATFMHDGHPLKRRELFEYPFTVESSETGVFLAPERHVWFIIDRLVVDVNHAGFDFSCKIGRAINRSVNGTAQSIW